jgi:hypothetical protein
MLFSPEETLRQRDRQRDGETDREADRQTERWNAIASCSSVALCCSSVAALLQLCCSSVAALLHLRASIAVVLALSTVNALIRSATHRPLYDALHSHEHRHNACQSRCQTATGGTKEKKSLYLRKPHAIRKCLRTRSLSRALSSLCGSRSLSLSLSLYLSLSLSLYFSVSVSVSLSLSLSATRS